MEESSASREEPADAEAPSSRKDVSVARWEVDLGMAEVCARRGKMWESMGVMRRGKLFCHVEEAVYLVAQGSLVLFEAAETDRLMPLFEVYNLLVVPAYGCSWAAYQTFAYLKRLGYIVGRFEIKWTDSRKRDVFVRQDIADSGIEPNSCASSELTNGSVSEDCNWEVSAALEDLSLKMNDPTVPGAQDLSGCQLTFDVHLPNGRFKKSDPGLPAFRLCISDGQPPVHSKVRELEVKSGRAPVKFASVECGHVSIFSFSSFTVPELP